MEGTWKWRGRGDGGHLPGGQCVRAYLCVCARACVSACVCVRARVCACVRMCVRVWTRLVVGVGSHGLHLPPQY